MDTFSCYDLHNTILRAYIMLIYAITEKMHDYLYSTELQPSLRSRSLFLKQFAIVGSSYKNRKIVFFIDTQDSPKFLKLSKLGTILLKQQLIDALNRFKVLLLAENPLSKRMYFTTVLQVKYQLCTLVEMKYTVIFEKIVICKSWFLFICIQNCAA